MARKASTTSATVNTTVENTVQSARYVAAGFAFGEYGSVQLAFSVSDLEYMLEKAKANEQYHSFRGNLVAMKSPRGKKTHYVIENTYTQS